MNWIERFLQDGSFLRPTLKSRSLTCPCVPYIHKFNFFFFFKKKEKNLRCHYLVAISILADVRARLVLSCVLVLFWMLWDQLADLRCVQILD